MEDSPCPPISVFASVYIHHCACSAGVSQATRKPRSGNPKKEPKEVLKSVHVERSRGVQANTARSRKLLPDLVKNAKVEPKIAAKRRKRQSPLLTTTAKRNAPKQNRAWRLTQGDTRRAHSRPFPGRRKST